MKLDRPQVAWLLLTLAVLYFCLFHGLGAMGLIGPDEPRYAAIAREMAESGDWVTPRLHGKPWFEKPVLYYWAAAIQYKLWGDSEFAARIPSAIAASVTTLALGWLAWKSYGWCAAAIVLFLFPTTVAAIGFGRAATTDMLFAASLALAMVAAARIVRPGRGPTDLEETAYAGAKSPARRRMLLSQLARCGFGAALGLAALAKGPAAIVLAGGSVGLWAVATRRWRDAFALLHPLAVLTFAAVALPWYVLCALRNPEFIDVFLVSHNFQRFLTPVFRHEQPFWFFGPVLIVALFPWTLLLAGTVRDGIALMRSESWRWSSSLFFACWVVFPFFFFSLSKSKLPGYILPAIPAIALLLARSLNKAADENAGKAGRFLMGTGVALLILGGAAALPQSSAQLPEAGPYALRLIAFVAGVGGVVVIYFAARKKPWLAMGVTTATVAALCFVITSSLLPRMDPQRSPRTAALRMMQMQRANDAVGYKLHRAWSYGLSYYLQREMQEWIPGEPAQVIVTSEAGLRDLESKGIRVVVIERVSSQAVIAKPQTE